MKIGFVVQRYGLEVNGGSELHCRLLAEKMSAIFDIEVLTTCALDYITWQNYYKPGLTTINNVKIRRFKVDHPRNINKFNHFSKKIFGKKSTIKEQLEWMDLQGPYCPDLINFLKSNNNSYDLIIFYTYLYWPTFNGLKIAPHKSILLPTAHDEPPIFLDIFKESFSKPKAFIYLTEPEKQFVNNKFNNQDKNSITIGMGVDDFEIHEAVNKSIKEKYSLPQKYVLYAGRIAEAKGCDHLFEYFINYAKKDEIISLVLIGKEIISVPKHPRIISLGFVTEEDKHYLMNNCELVVIPSEYESLSIVAIEAWQLKKPILANAKSAVLKDHCLQSNGGLYYNNHEEFTLCLDKILKQPNLGHSLGLAGWKYVEKNYNWSAIKQRFSKFIKTISE